MNKGIFLAPVLLAAGALRAQEPTDALRFSQTFPGATARQQAIGGAMGSLGGDYGATFVNPAGLGFYRTGDFVFTPSFHWGDTKADYLGRTEKSKEQRFDFSSIGVVLGHAQGKRGERGSAFTLGFSTQADFRSELRYLGRNRQSSYSQRFLEELQRSGVRDGSAAYLYPTGSSLAINTFWLDPVKDGSGAVTGFATNSPIATGLIQEQYIRSRGGIYEAAVGGGEQVTSKWFVGGTLGIPFLYYDRKATFTEADATTDTSNRFDFAEYRENLNTSGVGINVRLGAIYKPTEFWRLGLSFQSPTLYKLTDRYSYELTTNTEHYEGEWTDYSKDYNDGKENEFRYRLVTPLKVTGSVSFVIRETQDVSKQRGFITADAEFVHYPMMKYLTDNDAETDDSGNQPYLDELNRAIRNAYHSAFNFRVGGELKFTTWMVRAGAAYYGNPYKEVNGGTGHRLNLSGGLGYRDKGYFIDLTYVHSLQKDINAPYRLAGSPYPIASTNRMQGNVALTVGVKF
ncbi:hypothetical protein EPD60_07430 [Flaviaesturariibacter flavus]|uniref:Aromatic hydrocarbon degradation protein n=1 Tax=Flaviaesturariibacter flavus TaxID=2502780 RepID=A0A4R1BHI3_9BACT|nr:hypothetical protein [Flaviaesturariibacter flavus]TCJ16568.1 hypothetical protein EPD60_07430 [Flaviaesturariibacter flavus]